MRGQAANDRLVGGNGNDAMYGGTGSDLLAAGAGDDSLFGEDGVDTLSGGTGNDHLDGGNGRDLMDGGVGNDTMIGGVGPDTFIISHQGSSSNGNIDEIYDLDFDFDQLTIRAFAGNSEVNVTSIGELFNLTLNGLSFVDTGNDTTLIFDEGPGAVHSVNLIGIDDPLSVG